MGEIEATQYEPALSAPEQPVELEEERAGVLSRVREMAVNAWDTVSRHPKTVLAIGAASLSLAYGAETLFNPEPVKADPNVPTATHKGNLQQYCGSQMLAKKTYKVKEADMGKPGQKFQDVYIRMHFNPVDPACNGNFYRGASVRSFIDRHGKTINENPDWAPLLMGKNTNGASDPINDTLNSSQDPNLEYRKGDKVFFKLRLQEFSQATNKAVKTVIEKFRVKVGR